MFIQVLDNGGLHSGTVTSSHGPTYWPGILPRQWVSISQSFFGPQHKWVKTSYSNGQAVAIIASQPVDNSNIKQKLSWNWSTVAGGRTSTSLTGTQLHNEYANGVKLANHFARPKPSAAYGDRAFSVYAPILWNCLYVELRCIDDSLRLLLKAFEPRLETRLKWVASYTWNPVTQTI